MDIRFRLQNTVKTLRTKQGLTQEELAAKAEIDYKYLQRIEGRNPPNIGILLIEKIAKALGTSAEKLIK